MKQHQRRRLAAAVTATALIGASIVAGAISTPGQIHALPGAEESTIVNVEPTRVLDTRVPVGLTGKFQSMVPRKLMVTGSIETYVEATETKTTKVVVPAGATGVIMNVTAVAPTALGFLSIRPGDATGLPSTAGLNFKAGDVIPNHVSVAMPTAGPNAGMIDIAYVAGIVGPTMDVVVDIVGYTTKTGLADLVTVVGTKANSADVYPKAETYAKTETYAKAETFTQTEVLAAIAVRSPIARSAHTTNVEPDPIVPAVALSVTIVAPLPGIIQIVGSSLILTNGNAGRYECNLTLGAGVTNSGPGALDDSDRAVYGTTDRETCITTGAVTVTTGTHIVNLVLQGPAATSNFDDTTLDAVYYPGGVQTSPLMAALDADDNEDS